MTRFTLILACALTVTLSACTFGMPIGTRSNTSDAGAIEVPAKTTRSTLGNPTSYVVLGKRFSVMDNEHGFVQRGLAS